MAISRFPFKGSRIKPKPTEIANSVSPGKLSEIKKIALRRGTWFKALSRIERSTIDLTVRYVDNIRSQKLAKIVTAIIQKLDTAMEGIVDRLVRTIGLPLARKMSSVAQKLGSPVAKQWASDRSFACFLALTVHDLRGS